MLPDDDRNRKRADVLPNAQSHRKPRQLQMDQSRRTLLKGQEAAERTLAKGLEAYGSEKEKPAWHLTYTLSTGRGPA